MKQTFFSILGRIIPSMVAPTPSSELAALHRANQEVGAAADRLCASADDIGKIVRNVRRGRPRKKKAVAG